MSGDFLPTYKPSAAQNTASKVDRGSFYAGYDQVGYDTQGHVFRGQKDEARIVKRLSRCDWLRSLHWQGPRIRAQIVFYGSCSQGAHFDQTAGHALRYNIHRGILAVVYVVVGRLLVLVLLCVRLRPAI